MIKVCFRGPMLFVTDTPADDEKKDVVDRVVIPDAREAAEHDDGTPAIAHVAGLLLVQKGQLDRHIPLAGRSVQIIGGTGAPGVDDKFLGVPPVHRMLHPEGVKAPPVRRLKSPEGEPIIITFTGGSMSGEMVMDKARTQLRRHKKEPEDWVLTAMPTWQTDAAKVTIKLVGGEDGGGEIELGPETTVYLYNWDYALPTAGSLRIEMPATKDVVDHDFKWVYDLMTPENQTWSDWLEDEEQLPAPQVKKEPGTGFTSPPCNSARVRGMATI